MSNWYISSVGYAAVAQWAAGHVYAAGAIVRQLASPNVGSERCFRTTAGGTSAGSEPTWNLARGSAQPTDNTITDWVECTGAEARQSPGAWAAPAARLNSMTKTAYVSAAVVNSQGVATYAVGDILTAAIGTGSVYGDNATFRVATLNAGKVATVTIVNGGAYQTNPSVLTGNAVTGGGGTGCTLNLTMTNWSALTDSFYVSSNHAETQATALTIAPNTVGGGTNSQPTTLCVDETASGHVPPTSADLKTTATVSTTGASSLTVTSIGYVYGIAFSAGSGANTVNLIVSGVGMVTLDACGLILGGTTGGGLDIGVNGSGRILLNNTTFKVSAAASGIVISGGSPTLWRNTPSAIQGATVPTNLITSIQGVFILDGVDLSALGSGKNILLSGATSTGEVDLINCALGASLTIFSAPTASSAPRVRLINCDSAGTNYRTEQSWFEGAQTVETTIIRTGGASNGATAISQKFANTANVAWWHPLQSFPIAALNAVTGTNRVVTLYGIWNAAALPNNDDIWIEAQYLGSAAGPQASFANNSKANILASNAALTADSTSAWDSLVTARANSHTYSVGDVIKLASNSGRIFFCTTGGASAGSEPGGYASAVDGGSVTDNAAVFRAGRRFVLTVTLSSPQPAMAGPIYVTVNAAKVSSTFWVDPLIILS